MRLPIALLLTAIPVIFAESFDFETLLDKNHDFRLKWNYDNESIDIEVSAKTLGWIAFGFSPNGGMDQSDVLFGFVENGTGRGNITDRFLVANKTHVQLQLDKQQDWILLNAAMNETHTTLRVRRKLETCDPFDHPIMTDTMRVIYGLHNLRKIDYLKPMRHQFRGSRSILFLDPSLATRKSGVPIQPVATLVWNIAVDGVVVPQGVSSMYHCKLVKVPEFTKKLHIVQVVPKVEEHNLDLVHHIEVNLCSESITDAFMPKEFVCATQNMSASNRAAEVTTMMSCNTLIHVWAVGGSTFTFPEEAGYPVGPDLRGRYIYIQMHYNNPSMQKRVDSSGLQMFLTDKLRKYDAGSMVLGTASYEATMTIPPKTDSFMHFGLCDDSCTRASLPADGINAFAGFLHSHLTGRKLRMRHIRDGAEIPAILEDNHYDFNYQETRGLTPRRKILQGDEILLECEYSTTSTDTVVLGGMATSNEMCFGALLYYPKVELSTCASRYDMRTVAEALEMHDVLNMIQEVRETRNSSRLNGTTNPYEEFRAMAPALSLLTERLGTYNWSKENIQTLQDKYRSSNLSSYCVSNTISQEQIAIPRLPQAVEQSSSVCRTAKKETEGKDVRNVVKGSLPLEDKTKAKDNAAISSKSPVFLLLCLCALTASRFWKI